MPAKKGTWQDTFEPDPHPNSWYRAYKSDLKILEAPIHTRRPLRIVVIGAGAGGLLVAYQAARQLCDVEFVVYEKNDDVGGTWYENRYPGLEIDSPSHTYQWSFRRNPEWSRYMASGREVWAYLKKWAVEDGIMKDVKLSHRVESAIWNQADAVWEIKGKASGDRPFSDRCDILFACNGGLNNPKWPDVPGIDNYKGTLIHSARWPEDLDLKGKTVAVIGGSGASGVQIVPAIQPDAEKLIVYLRSKFWAVSGLRSKFVGPENKNFDYSEEHKQLFRERPDLLAQYQRDVEDELNWLFEAGHIKSSLSQKVSAILRAGTIQNFGEGAAAYLPDYGYGCRRSLPAQAFPEALQRPNVEVVRAAVTGFTETGLIDSNGDTKEADITICATSFKAGVPAYRLIGRNGRDFGKEMVEIGSSYMSCMNEGFPNMFYIISSNSPANHGALLPMLEWYVRYAFKILAHVQRTSIRTFMPKKSAQEDFYEWTHQLMKRLTVSEPCFSWFKQGKDHGPVTAVYAGSRGHFYEALKEPRLEDFEFEYDGNRLRYFGNGYAPSDITLGSDPGWYFDVLREEAKMGTGPFEMNPMKARGPFIPVELVAPKGKEKVRPKL